jgi:prepilin-type processing-associated H-X9-DG protein
MAGLTRSELAVVIVVVLAGGCLLLPWLVRSRDYSRRLNCEQRLKVAAETLLFVSELRPGKELPGYANEQAVDAAGRRQKTGWAFSLLSYLDAPRDPKTGGFLGPEHVGPWDKLHQQFGPPGADAFRGKPPDVYLPHFVCPDDPRAAREKRRPLLSFVANCGLPDAEPKDGFPADWPANGVFLERFLDRDPSRSVTRAFVEEHDGAAYTLLFSENIDAGKWTDAAEAQVGFLWYPGTAGGAHDPAGPVLYINQERGKGDGSMRFARPASLHERGVNVVYCDGHTRFIEERLDFRIYAAQMTPHGPEAKWPGSDRPLDPPWREERGE